MHHMQQSFTVWSNQAVWEINKIQKKTRKRPELSNNQNLADSDIWSNVSISEIGCSCTKEVFYTMRCFFPPHIILQMDTHVCPCVMRFISVLKNEKNALYSSLKTLTRLVTFKVFLKRPLILKMRFFGNLTLYGFG